jgi:hypothetical protein
MFIINFINHNSGISPSALANAGLLMACLVVDGEEVISVNMVR